jgi:hypothetical protein
MAKAQSSSFAAVLSGSSHRQGRHDIVRPGMKTRRKLAHLRPLPRTELDFREWAAHRLRKRLITHPWYALRDAESGMEFWRQLQGSQVNVGRQEYEAAMTGPDVPLLPRTWRLCRYRLRNVRRAATVELAARASAVLDLRYSHELRNTLDGWRCYWRCLVAGGRSPTLKTLGEPPLHILVRRIRAKGDA